MPLRRDSPSELQLPARGQFRPSAPSVVRTRCPARSTCPPRPALKPVLPHTSVWTTPRGTRLCDLDRSRPGVRHRGHVDRANFVQFGRAAARPNHCTDPQSGRGPAKRRARRIPTRLRRVKIRRAPTSHSVCGMHAFRKLPTPRPTPTSSGTPTVRMRRKSPMRRIDHKSTAPRAQNGVAAHFRVDNTTRRPAP